MLKLVRNYPIAAFMLLAILLGFGEIWLVLAFQLPPVLILLSVLSAGTAGLLITWVLEGGEAVLKLLWGLCIWRVSPLYYVFSFLGIALFAYLGIQLSYQITGSTNQQGGFEAPFNLLLLFLAFFVVSGVGQEIGWSGFLSKYLLQKHSFIKSGFLRALFVWLWHFPILIASANLPKAMQNYQYANWILEHGLLCTSILTLLLFILPWSILSVWLFKKTQGSLLLVSILHASEIWVPYLMLGNGLNPGQMSNYWGYALIMLIFSVSVLMLEKGGLRKLQSLQL